MVPVGVAKVHDHHDVLHRTGRPPSHTRLDTEQSNMTEQRGFRLGAGHAPRLRREGRRGGSWHKLSHPEATKHISSTFRRLKPDPWPPDFGHFFLLFL